MFDQQQLEKLLGGKIAEKDIHIFYGHEALMMWEAF